MRAASQAGEAAAPAIEARGVTKRYGATIALNDVDFRAERGSIHALIGHNGAGKSTLVKILSGVVRPDEGEVLIDRRAVTLQSTQQARLLGISVVHQDFSLIPTMSAAENIGLPHLPEYPFSWVSRSRELTQASEALTRLGVDIDPRSPVGELSRSDQQVVEIAKAIVGQHHVVILDEPTSSLTDSAIKRLFRILRQLAADGAAIIYISHHLKEVLEIANEITCMRDGMVVHRGLAVDETLDSLVRAIAGTPARTEEKRLTDSARQRRGAVMLETIGLSASGVHDVNLLVHSGEILGVAGLVGSGAEALLSMLFGIRPRKSGRILVSGHEVQLRHPEDALTAGIMMIPRDRRRHGLVVEHTVRENLTLAWIKDNSRLVLDHRRADALTRHWVSRLSIHSQGTNQSVAELSGGNQQKVVIARALAVSPRVLLLDDPTVGVDIGTRWHISDIVRDFVDGGGCAIWVSSEFGELLRVADYIAVIRAGRLAATLDPARASITEEDLLSAVQ